MEAIESLMFEHRLIERSLAALEGFTQSLHGQDGREELGRFVRFLRGYADKLHHGKEEGLLFTRMAEVGFPSDSGPVAVMLHDHDAGRALVTAMDELARRPQPWTEVEAGRVTEAAASFATLLRDHIRKEDRILYPMAEEHLSPQALDALGAAFDRHAEEHADAERELTELGTALSVRWSVEDPTACPPSECGACSGCGGLPVEDF
ncbi:MAG TPA: hemerythrin domain-containing protein [Myxococcales bacterium]|jgi:hemerythrin-like domain-containing protein